jgi:hypothetical protein
MIGTMSINEAYKEIKKEEKIEEINNNNLYLCFAF